MAPKHSRAPGLVRAHSRSTSATKLPAAAATLQFTQKKALVSPPSKQNRPPSTNPPHHHQPRQKQPPQQKQRPGFHIDAEDDEDDDEDGDWVSSESGAVTPNLHNDNEDSDLDSPGSNGNARRDRELQRVATARLSDYYERPPPPETKLERPPQTARPATATIDTTARSVDTRGDTRTPTAATDGPSTPVLETAPPSQAPSPSRNKRHSRPMSTHSITRPELRPHPLIRGQSFGQPNLTLTPKPSPLLPIAVTRDADVSGTLSTSPTASLASPTSPFPVGSVLGRRTSISSNRSVATVATPHKTQAHSVREARHRTFSTLSTASSSAALSSLTHLPAVSRPPTPQMIAFFPPPNPFDPKLDDVHPLLPPPYAHNHFTVISHRVPIREAFDRVLRARQSAATRS